MTRSTAWAVLIAVLAASQHRPGRAQAEPPAPSATVNSAYLTGCGGCHGVAGRSYAPRVPDLASQAGYLLCTPDGRAYMARLPNVAFSGLSAADLAQVLNYVAFTLGAGTAPQNAPPYTEAEIAAQRGRPLDGPSMMATRTRIVAGVLQACPAARGLLAYGEP